MTGDDLRAFRWPLHAVAGKQQVDTESRRLALAQLQGREAAQREQVRALDERHARELRMAAATQGAVLDAASHARSLHRLVRQEGALQEQRALLAEILRSVDVAKQACLAARRQAECLDRLRVLARGDYLARLQRANAKEADAAWLALHARESGGNGTLGDVA